MESYPSRTDHRIAAALFLAAFLIYWACPVHQMADSNTSMLLSQSLLERGSFQLEPYFRDRWVPPQLESKDGHLYYLYPPGTSLLSLPLVATLRSLGYSATTATGLFDEAGEEAMQAIVAACVCALTAAVFFGTARLLLPVGLSLIVAVGGAFGTQVWSTASRATWAHAWEVLLLSLALKELLADASGRKPLNPDRLGLLAALMYWVRPTASLAILGISLYLLLRRRHLLLRYASVAGAGFCLLVAYASFHFGRVLPNYYLMSSILSLKSLAVGLYGTLFGPSRGLLIYVPVTLFVGWLLIRRWATLPHRDLVWMALGSGLAHLAVISAWPIWWGGHSYGPRLATSLVPWLVLLGILGLRGLLEGRHRCRKEIGAGAFLLVLSIFMNALGALSFYTWLWNSQLSLHGWSRLWDWKRAQFRAAFVWPIPGDGADLMAGSKVSFGTIHAEPYLRKGWGQPLAGTRWTTANTAQISFNLEDLGVSRLRMRIQPFIVRGRVDRQRVIFLLNGQRIQRWSLSKRTSDVRELELPTHLIREHNILEIRLPDAASPAELGLGTESAKLGIGIWWLELK